MSEASLPLLAGGGEVALSQRASVLFQEHLDANYRRTSRIFTGLMFVQWVSGIVLAVVWSPYAWAGRVHSVHVHVYTAVFLGAAISSLPIALTLTRPTAESTRYAVAIAQMLWSALLIHLSGGRIETHFHIFASLAFLAFYRDWRILIPATLVIAGDHLLRGLWWPESVYGVANGEWWRFLEHAFWVVCEDVVLVLACLQGVRELRLVADRQAAVELSLERVNELNQELDLRVEERTQQLSDANGQLSANLESLNGMQRQLVQASRHAGMAEVATSVLHNVGNVLNSVNISSGLIAETVRSSKASGLLKLGALLAEPDFAIALAGHPKGHAVPAYVARLAGALHDEQEKMAKEAEGMQRSINHIKAIVGMQQAKAKGGSEMLELLSLRAVAEDVVRMAGVSSESSSIKVVYDFEDVALTLIDRHKVYQILLNLVNNARHAVQDGRPGEGRITLRLRQESGGALKLEVQDTGCGIRSEDMKKIFNYGFTTRREGHGFGLHGSACAALEMGGSLTCHSDGPGLGAVFSLTLPPRPHRLAA